MYIKKPLLTRNGYAFIQNDTVITYFFTINGETTCILKSKIRKTLQ